MATPTDNLWSRRIARQDIPDEGLQVDFAADESVRASLARAAQLRDLPRLSASFFLTRRAGEAVHVTGEVSADVVQDCVVTLEPIEQNLVESVDLTFVPPSAAPGGETTPEVNLSEGEPPEVLVGGQIDLGAIATEYFLLGLDPYPRKPGAQFEPPAVAGAGASPFAALAELKKRKPGNG